MSTPFIGEIRMFAGNFAPAGWAFCDGQLLPIAENDALFVLIGTTYGGDGQETFALPDLRGRIPVHNGQGPGTSNYVIGEIGGVESVTLTTNQIPNHNHPVFASGNNATDALPGGKVPAVPESETYVIPDGSTTVVNMTTATIAGGSQPHDNMMPFLCINFIISLFGIFPTQN